MMKTTKTLLFIVCAALLSCSDSLSDGGNNTETVKDIEGNVYKTVKIGDQWWMAENLKVTRYRNGDAILRVPDNTQWSELISGAYCNYNNNVKNVATYGRLYNWQAVNDPRGLAPAGWHIPTDEEWKQLEIYLGMSQTEADDISWRGAPAGGKLKESGTVHWMSPNTGASNESGFSAIPGGYRDSNGSFGGLGSDAHFWSATEGTIRGAFRRYLSYDNADISRYNYRKPFGFSVRCVKD